MKYNKSQDNFPLGGECPNSDKFIRKTELGHFSDLLPNHNFKEVKTDTLIPELGIKGVTYQPGKVFNVPVKDIEISSKHLSVYNTEVKKMEIDLMKSSIKECGQLEPIVIMWYNGRWLLIDGVLRFLALMLLGYEFVKVIISPSAQDGDTFDNVFQHYHIRKELTVSEKLKQVIEDLQIGRREPNKYIGMDKRRQFVSKKLGKGFSGTNLKKLEKVIQFEMDNGFDMQISEGVLGHKVNITNAEKLINEVKESEYTPEYESKHVVIKGFIDQKYDLDEAIKNLYTATKKNKSKGENNTPKLHSRKSENYEIREGDVFEVDLTNDSYDNVFSSPPYSLQREYGDSIKEIGVEKDVDEYIQNLVDVFEKAYNQLNDTGSIFVNLNDTWKDGFSLNVIEKFVVEMEKRGIRKVQMVQWEKPNPKPQGSNVHRFVNKFEAIIHFAKTPDYTWNKIGKKKTNLKIQAGCSEVGAKKKGYSIPEFITASYNLLSENMIEGIDGLSEFTTSLKNNPMVLKRQFLEGEKKHTATFNVLLPLIPLMSTLPTDRQGVVFDPFAGTSSSGECALAIGHKFIGIELYDYNCETSARVLGESEEKFRDFNLMEELFEPEYLQVA